MTTIHTSVPRSWIGIADIFAKRSARLEKPMLLRADPAHILPRDA
jgi:hypothetical protein